MIYRSVFGEKTLEQTQKITVAHNTDCAPHVARTAVPFAHHNEVTCSRL